jgi:hypothetical protein
MDWEYDAEFGADDTYSDELWSQIPQACPPPVKPAQPTPSDSMSASNASSLHPSFDAMYSTPAAARAALDLPSTTGVSQEQWEKMQHELQNVSEMEKDTTCGLGVVEDSLFDDEDEFDGAEEDVEKESDGDQARTGILHEYLIGQLERIKKEIETKHSPQNYRHGSFWLRPKDPLFAQDISLKRGETIGPTPYYLLNIFVWIPFALPTAPDIFFCECGKHLSKNGTY